jgi:ABC-2 type transport system permease protein
MTRAGPSWGALRAILAKELKVLWASPLPYVLGAAYTATLGVLGWSQIAQRGQAVFQPLVPIAGLLIVLVAPVLASRTFSEEIRTGTLELLLAIPVRRRSLVAGKYLAVLGTLLMIVTPIGLFALLLSFYGDPDPGPMVSGAIGLILMGAAVTAIGVAASSLTASQPVAAIAGILGVLVLWFAHTGSEALPVGAFLGAFSISERLRGFAGGVVDLADVTFFVAIVGTALAVTAAAVEARRWR